MLLAVLAFHDNGNSLKEIVFPNSIISVDIEMMNYQKETIQTKLVFLGKKSNWFLSTSNRYRMNHYIVYCSLGSEILKSSVKLGYEVHPLSEYIQDQ